MKTIAFYSFIAGMVYAMSIYHILIYIGSKVGG